MECEYVPLDEGRWGVELSNDDITSRRDVKEASVKRFHEAGWARREF